MVYERGQINLKPFVQFVHFVPIATLHAVARRAEPAKSQGRGKGAEDLSGH